MQPDNEGPANPEWGTFFPAPSPSQASDVPAPISRRCAQRARARANARARARANANAKRNGRVPSPAAHPWYHPLVLWGWAILMFTSYQVNWCRHPPPHMIHVICVEDPEPQLTLSTLFGGDLPDLTTLVHHASCSDGLISSCSSVLLPRLFGGHWLAWSVHHQSSGLLNDEKCCRDSARAETLPASPECRSLLCLQTWLLRMKCKVYACTNSFAASCWLAALLSAEDMILINFLSRPHKLPGTTARSQACESGQIA